MYLNDLNRTSKMGFDKLYLVHTLSLDPESIVVDADHKLHEYIDYRYARLNNMIKFLRVRLFESFLWLILIRVVRVQLEG